MASSYPAALDSLATSKADATTTATDHPAHHNNLADAVNKIEAELGTAPRGPVAATVKERFELLDEKLSCRLASTAAVSGTYAAGPPATLTTAASTLTLDGVAVVNGDRVFLKDQATPAENGIYLVSGVGSTVVLTRTVDADTSAKMADATVVKIEQGAANSDSQWELITNNPITLGTTGLQFTRNIPAYALPYRDPWNPTPTVGGGTLTQLRQASLDPRSTMASVAGVSGRIQVIGGFVVPAGQPVTNVAIGVSTAGATLANQWAGICDVNRVIKGISADRTNEAWAQYVVKQFPLGAAWTPDVDTLMWIFYNVTASTVPGVLGASSGSTLIGAWTPMRMATGATGQTTPPANGATLAAFTGYNVLTYAGWS